MFAEQYNAAHDYHEAGAAVLDLRNARRIIVLSNPCSSHASELAAEISQLHPADLGDAAVREFIPVSTQKALADTKTAINEAMAESTGIIIVGGDGSYNQGLQAAMDSQVPLSVGLVAAGHASDLSRQAYRLRQPKNIKKIIENSWSVPVNPLEVTTKLEGEASQTNLYFGYYSIGYAAVMANQFNDPSYRRLVARMPSYKRYAMDLQSVVKGIAEAEELTLMAENVTQGITDMTYSNGNRMARFLRFGQLLLQHPRAARLITPHAQSSKEILRKSMAYAHFGTQIVHATTGKFNELYAGEQDKFTIDAAKDITVQGDGEARVVPPRTHFRIRHALSRVHIATTK